MLPTLSPAIKYSYRCDAIASLSFFSLFSFSSSWLHHYQICNLAGQDVRFQLYQNHNIKILKNYFTFIP